MRIKQDTKSVYIIYNVEVKRTKIGYSSNIEQRLNSLRFQSWCGLRLIYNTKPIYNYADVEKNMHNLFSDRRVVGEWFNIDYKQAVIRLKALVSDDDVCRIVKSYESGKNATRIANSMGVSRSGVVKYLQGKGYMIKKSKEKLIAQSEIRSVDIKHTNIPSSRLLDMVKANNEKLKKKKRW